MRPPNAKKAAHRGDGGDPRNAVQLGREQPFRSKSSNGNQQARDTAITPVAIDDVVVSEGRRSIDQRKVAALVESLGRLGLLQPIIVREFGGQIHLIAGAHRLAAAKSIGWTHINAAFSDGDDIRARLAEIAENLYRIELSALEHDELLAEWIRLTEAVQSEKTGLSVMSWYCRLAQIGRQKMRDGAKRKDKGSGAAGSTFYDDRIPFSPEVR